MTPLTRRQRIVFQRAVLQRSRGQVRMPGLDLGQGDAIALWQDLALAFGAFEGRPLSPRELAHLRQRAWRRSAGHIVLSQGSMTLAGGLALWSLAGRIEALLARQPHSRLAHAARIAAIALAAPQLAACTSLWGGNIKGNFACGAPSGSCAPSTVIDDQALAVIQTARAVAPQSPYFKPQTPQSARLVSSGRGKFVAAGAGAGARARAGVAYRERRVLRIVFPSHVDASGNFHEPRIVHTVADAGGWVQLSGRAPGAGEQASAPAERASAILSPRADPHTISDPQITAASKLLPDLDQVPGPVAQIPGQEAVSSGLLPDPDVVAQARAKGAVRAASAPIEAIRAEVDARLGAARTVARPAPAPLAPSGRATKPASGTKPAAQDAAEAPVAPAPLVANPPASFSGKIEE